MPRILPGPPFKLDVEQLANHVTRVHAGRDSGDSRRGGQERKDRRKSRGRKTKASKRE